MTKRRLQKQCPHCQKTFGCVKFFKQHILRHESQDKTKKWFCLQCDDQKARSILGLLKVYFHSRSLVIWATYYVPQETSHLCCESIILFQLYFLITHASFDTGQGGLEMHLNQINHVKNHLKAVETIGQANDYKRRRLRDQNNINYKNESDSVYNPDIVAGWA